MEISDEVLFIFDKLEEILFSLSLIFDKLEEILFSLSPIFKEISFLSKYVILTKLSLISSKLKFLLRDDIHEINIIVLLSYYNYF